VIIANVLPPNLVHPIARIFGFHMALVSFVNAMLLALGQKTFNQ
jgi:hypothetical protein